MAENNTLKFHTPFYSTLLQDTKIILSADVLEASQLRNNIYI
jgi:hypothetical protein